MMFDGPIRPAETLNKTVTYPWTKSIGICSLWEDMLKESPCLPSTHEEMKTTFVHYYSIERPDIKLTPSGWKEKWIDFIAKRSGAMKDIIQSKPLTEMNQEEGRFREISRVMDELEKKLGAAYFKSYVIWSEAKLKDTESSSEGHKYDLCIPVKHFYARQRLTTNARDQSILRSLEIKIL